jgi:fumarate hydratase subunit alpha
MKTIYAESIIETVKKMAMEASSVLEPDILAAMTRARDLEKSEMPRQILEYLLTNADIASQERIPLCQDTGIVAVFVEIGNELIIDGNIEEAIQEGVRQGYDEGYLRKSVCDPLTRKNSNTNLPAIIHFEPIPGTKLKISLLPKGCGSENMSGLKMLPPSAGEEGIINYVVDLVTQAGSNPCPPVVVGVGLGGTFEKAAILAKKSLLRPVGQASIRADAAKIEQEILTGINKKGHGAHGFGGNTTAMAVHLEVFPSHIASLPVAVNIQCHAHRYKKVVIE